MHSPNRKNPYSELGISESASAEEIRAVYLRLAKESHPDRAQAGQSGMDAAEKMTRLNEAMVILSDEGKRAEYDLEAARIRQASDVEYRNALSALKLSRGPGKRRKAGLVWVSCAAAGCLAVAGLAVLLLREDREDQWWKARVLREGVRKTGETLLGRPPAKETRGSRDVVETGGKVGRDGTRGIGDASLPPLRPVRPPMESFIALPGAAGKERQGNVPLPGVNPLPAPDSVAVVMKAPSPPPAAVVKAAVSLDPAPPGSATPPSPALPSGVRAGSDPAAVGASGWNGIWRYLPGSGGGLGGTFNPVSIEMRVSSQGQKLLGLYRAQYAGTGKYSSEVAFLFEAPDDRGARVRGRWFGNNGEKGEFELTRLSAKEVQMSWWTTAFGKKKTLASGVARLGEGL